MTDEIKEEEWVIPTNVGFEIYKKVLGAFYQKNAESQEITTKTIASSVGSEPKSISGSIRFLAAINILNGDSTKGYKLTIKGTEYAKKIYQDDDKDAIKKIGSEIIKNSYLKTLVDYININKGDLQIDGLFKFIRTEGKFPEGAGPAGMTGPNATGARTLLQIFDSAGMFPENFNVSSNIDTRSRKKGETKIDKKNETEKKKRRSDAGNRTNHDTDTGDMANASFEDCSISMRKGIDQDTFDFIKIEVKNTLDFWEKKYVLSKNISENTESDTSE